MDVKIVAIMGGITAIGWLISHLLTIKREDIQRSRTALLNHTERQLEKLYGPLVFLIIEGKQTFNDLLSILGRKDVFIKEKQLPNKKELEIWIFWAENDFLPRNEKMKCLMMSNTHLIEEDVMPDCYKDFLNHCNSWSINHKRWKEKNIEYSWRSSIDWPIDFTNNVVNTFKILKERHASLLKKIRKKSFDSCEYKKGTGKKNSTLPAAAQK